MKRKKILLVTIFATLLCILGLFGFAKPEIANAASLHYASIPAKYHGYWHANKIMDGGMPYKKHFSIRVRKHSITVNYMKGFNQAFNNRPIYKPLSLKWQNKHVSSKILMAKNTKLGYRIFAPVTNGLYLKRNGNTLKVVCEALTVTCRR
ncbi:hypothetical protein [uncultured Lactobacillus sp.]|uniref:hypothetical protein n=1 Tax=uncultured Lactobacillus sp. TaxID=153152 RepID=UPI002806239D|nr:hypothetical protein [uncultured Lactobacillus sp.]